ncbi:MAG: DNA topoisomerase IV subunit A [Candidatus Aenigmatarchaeota archaeon]
MEEETKNKLKKIGIDVLTQIEQKKNPYLEVPIRSLSNVVYDEKTKLLTLGNKTSKRYFFNVAHAKKFMQTLIIASKTKELIDEGIHTSLRDMFYAVKRTLPNSNENTFDDQHKESDPIIEDLEVMLNLLREELHLNADVRGRVVGNVTIMDSGDTIHWDRLGSGGWAIPSNVENIVFKEVSADFCLVVEKNAVWERLNEDKFWKKHNCILVGAQGQAARGIRRLIKRLNSEFKLPVYVFCDCDAYGWYIYSVIKAGSMNLAHTSEKLATSSSLFIGLTMSDIINYDLKKYTIKANEQDIKRAKELANYKWFQHPLWQREINLMLKKGYKAELEALTSKGFKFVSENYLPEKIEKKDFLP